MFDPFSVDPHKPKSFKMRLHGHPVGKNHLYLWRCAWATLRGGNHLKWGFARGKSVNGFVIWSVHPEIPPFSVSARRTHSGPE